MTGDLLLRISGQGAVYIRTNIDEQSSDEDEDMLLRSPFETRALNDDIPPILLEQVDLTCCDNTGKCCQFNQCCFSKISDRKCEQVRLRLT